MDDHLRKSLGFSRINKRLFWSLFWSAWQKGVRKETIISGFQKTGIWPLDPPIVLNQLESITISSSSDSETPIRTAREARKLVKVVKQSIDVSIKQLDRLCDTLEGLTIENELLRHENGHLKSTIISQHKRRKNRQPLALGDELQGKAGWFVSPRKLANALQERDAKEAQILQDKKLRAIAKTERQTEAQIQRERVEARKQERKEKREQKEREAAARKRARERARASKKAQESPKKVQRSISISQKEALGPSSDEGGSKEDAQQSIMVSRTGRKVNLPTRFLE
jgi:hypothetical protein